MDNNAMFAAQQVQYNRMYGGLDAAAGRFDYSLENFWKQTWQLFKSLPWLLNSKFLFLVKLNLGI